MRVCSFRKGYTLVEMVVVMAIMAVISSIGVGGWIATRAQSQVDQAAEYLVTEIRDAQNKAFAVEKVSGQETRAWSVFLQDGGNSVNSGSFYLPAGSEFLSLNNSESRSFQQIEFRAMVDKKRSFSGQVYTSFATPFGTGFVHQAADTWKSNSEIQNRPAKDFVPVDGSAIYSDVVIQVVHLGSNKSMEVVIAPNGDVYVNR